MHAAVTKLYLGEESVRYFYLWFNNVL